MKAGRLLREARRRAGFTQRELAQRAGVAHSVVSRIESGAVDPRFETLDRLLRECGETLDALPRAGIGVDWTLWDELRKLRPSVRLDYAAREHAALGELSGRAAR